MSPGAKDRVTWSVLIALAMLLIAFGSGFFGGGVRLGKVEGKVESLCETQGKHSDQINNTRVNLAELIGEHKAFMHDWREFRAEWRERDLR